MLKVYINYPNSKFTMHANNTCSQIHKHTKSGQRNITINSTNLNNELTKFINKTYIFSSTKTNTALINNDMWLEIDFNNQYFEVCIAITIYLILLSHYRNFQKISPHFHC